MTRIRKTVPSVTLSLLLGLLLLLSVPPQTADAYATTGCKWSTKNINIDIRYVNGNFRTAIKKAITNYYNSTDVKPKAVETSGNSFTARNASYGANGWEGYATWTCVLGNTLSVDAKLNMYYLSGTEPITRLKVVWAHELGHGFGLNHVSNDKRVMYTSPSTAYNNGVTGLTSDEISGINSLY